MQLNKGHTLSTYATLYVSDALRPSMTHSRRAFLHCIHANAGSRTSCRMLPLRFKVCCACLGLLG